MNAIYFEVETVFLLSGDPGLVIGVESDLFSRNDTASAE